MHFKKNMYFCTSKSFISPISTITQLSQVERKRNLKTIIKNDDIMEQNDKSLTLYRHRSLQAVLTDGLSLYVKNFTKIVRSSWLQAIIYALTTGFSMAYFFTTLLPLWKRHSSMTPELLTWIGTLVLFIAAALLLAFAGGVSTLYEHSRTDAISTPRRWWGRWPWRLTLKGIVRLPKMLWEAIGKGQMGVLVAVGFVMLILTAVASLLLQLPAVIMAIANVEAATGRAAGDAVSMPDNLFLLNFATFTLCGLLQAYIHLATLYPLYYIYGRSEK